MKLIEPGFFKRNRNLFILALILFFVPAIIAALASFMVAGEHLNIVSNMISNTPSNSTLGVNEVSVSSLELFAHNFVADVLTVVGGLFFSIISVILVVFNSASIASVFGVDFQFAAVSILPHAIFEYAATIFSLTAAFILTKLEIDIIKSRNVRGTIENNRVMLKDFLVMFIFMTVLLVIAAVVEGHITGLIVKMFYGM